MNTLKKYLSVCLLTFLIVGVQAQPDAHDTAGSQNLSLDGAMVLGLDESSIELSSVGACYIPWLDGVVLIDSAECSIHFLVRDGDEMCLRGTYCTDIFKGRHDLKKIVRPVSVGVMGNSIVLLASSMDSSFLALLPIDVKEETVEMEPCSMMGFGSNAYAFRLLPESNEIFVIGKNPLGYDIHYVSFSEDMTELAASTSTHYHLPRQAERIQSSDPNGFGLTIVAILVVFLLLTCICFIMKFFAQGVAKMQNRSKENVSSPVKTSAVQSGSSDEEVYAAIAAAIHLYNEEMHDEENTIITIQKVERSWTPWNAKFYNMNQYFNNRR